MFVKALVVCWDLLSCSSGSLTEDQMERLCRSISLADIEMMWDLLVSLPVDS
jgi:hypothetical protein